MKNIIIVDMQNGFINKENSHLIDKINAYLNDNMFNNIFLTQCTNDENSPFRKILGWNGLESPEKKELAIDYPKMSKIITKNCYGLSYKDIDYFKECGIKEMEICGTDTDACVLAIAFNLFDNGIKPIILSNLCATSSNDNTLHTKALEIMKRQFGLKNVK